MYLLHSVRHIHMESPGFIVDISQDNLAVGPKEFLEIFVSQLPSQEGTHLC